MLCEIKVCSYGYRQNGSNGVGVPSFAREVPLRGREPWYGRPFVLTLWSTPLNLTASAVCYVGRGLLCFCGNLRIETVLVLVQLGVHRSAPHGIRAGEKVRI